MSVTATRIPLAQAEQLAGEVAELLKPACTRIEVAGSIRRQKPDIGDIELVCVPKVIEVRDIFGDTVPGAGGNLLDCAVDCWLRADRFSLRPDTNGRTANGSRYKRLTYKGFGLDLFAVLEPAQWGVIFTIRTGPAEFSRRLVTSRLLGGWLPAGWHVKGGALWDGGAGLIPTPEEADLFFVLAAPVPTPERRTDTVTLVPGRKGQLGQWVDRGRSGREQG